MKDNLIFLAMAVTIITVFVVATGLRNYWNDEVNSYVHDYQHTTLHEICNKFDGSGDWETYEVERNDNEGNVVTVERAMFVCRLYN